MNNIFIQGFKYLFSNFQFIFTQIFYSVTRYFIRCVIYLVISTAQLGSGRFQCPFKHFSFSILQIRPGAGGHTIEH